MDFFDLGLQSSEIVVCFFLERRAASDGWVRVSQEKMANLCGVARTTLTRSLSSLEEKGIIEHAGGGTRGKAVHAYRLRDLPVASDSSAADRDVAPSSASEGPGSTSADDGPRTIQEAIESVALSQELGDMVGAREKVYEAWDRFIFTKERKDFMRAQHAADVTRLRAHFNSKVGIAMGLDTRSLARFLKAVWALSEYGIWDPDEVVWKAIALADGEEVPPVGRLG